MGRERAWGRCEGFDTRGFCGGKSYVPFDARLTIDAQQDNQHVARVVDRHDARLLHDSYAFPRAAPSQLYYASPCLSTRAEGSVTELRELHCLARRECGGSSFDYTAFVCGPCRRGPSTARRSELDFVRDAWVQNTHPVLWGRTCSSHRCTLASPRPGLAQGFAS